MDKKFENEIILVVDDEPRNLRIIQKALDKKYNIEVAENGTIALNKVKELKPAVVLLDIMLPDIDGYLICEEIKKIDEEGLIKIIFVSGKAMVQEKLKGYSLGAIDYLTKPFVREELEAKLDVFLEIYSREKGLLKQNSMLLNTLTAYRNKFGDLGA